MYDVFLGFMHTLKTYAQFKHLVSGLFIINNYNYNCK